MENTDVGCSELCKRWINFELPAVAAAADEIIQKYENKEKEEEKNKENKNLIRIFSNNIRVKLEFNVVKNAILEIGII